MPNPLINIGSAVGDHTGTPGPRTWSQLINRLPNEDSMINAGSGDYVGTTEAKITLAGADALAQGKKYVFIPNSMLPYNASLVTFNNAWKPIREGGDISFHDPQAYGAAGNAVITARASGAGTKATITGQDDTVALQACINAAAANLEVVVLPPNNFKITAKLQLPSNTQLVGSGWNSQICPDWFDAGGAQSGGAAYIVNSDQTNGNSNIVIRNLYINGAGPGTPSASGLTNGIAAGIFIRSASSTSCQDILIRDVKITNTPGISIAPQGCQRLQVINNLIHDTGKDGITCCWFTGNARLQDVLIQGNTIFGPGDDAIAVLASQDSTSPNTDQRPIRIAVVGNVIRDINSNGVGRGIIIMGCDDVAVTGNVVMNSYSVGIAVWYDPTAGSSNFSCRKVAVTGNTVQDAGQSQGGAGLQPQYGINVRGCQFVSVAGNTVDHAYSSGIYVDDNGVAAGATSDITVTGNTVSNCGTPATDAGIYVKNSLGTVGSVQRINIVGNLSTLNFGGGIATQAADMVLIADNHCTNNGQFGTHTAFQAGIWAGTGVAIQNTVTIRGNFCTDTQGVKTQSEGIALVNLGQPVTSATILDNYAKGNFNSGSNSEVVIGIAPTFLSFRRDDQTQVLTSGATPAVSASFGENCTLTILTNIAVVIQNPTIAAITMGTWVGPHILRFAIRNGSGGALSTAPSFGTAYALNAAVVNPTNGTQVMYTFEWDPVQAKYYEIGSHAAAM